MSYGICVYATDVAALRRLVGVGVPVADTQLRILREKQGWAMESFDRWFEREIAEGAPKMADALEALLIGKKPNPRHGFAYAYALELLCAHCGRTEYNSTVYPASFAMIDDIDAAIAYLGVSDGFRIARLVLSGPPVAIPSPADFPAIGWIENAVVEEARQAFRARPIVDADPIPNALRMALAQVQDWTTHAKGMDLVGFYY